MSIDKRLATHHKITYYIVLLLVFLMPLYKKVIPYVITLLFVNWLLEGNFKERFKLMISSRTRLLTLSFALFYVVYLLGMLNSVNIEYGLFDLEVKLSLFLFPLLFATMSDEVFNEKRIYNILHAFIIGCVVGTVVCFANSIYNFYYSHSYAEFYYSKISFFHHTSYFSMYLNFAVAILIYFNLNKSHKLSEFQNITYAFLVLYFHLFIVLLSSKAGVISLIVVYAASIVYAFTQRKKIILSLYLFLLLGSFFVFLAAFPNSIKRILVSKNAVQQSSINTDTKEGTAERLLIWQSSFEIIKKHFVFGVGTGDVKDYLMQKYEEKDIKCAIEKKLNAHNQYIQTFITLGLVGFAILIFSLLLPAFSALRNNQILYFLFIVIVAFNILVESMFETQAGVVFYAFFNAFLFSIRKYL